MQLLSASVLAQDIAADNVSAKDWRNYYLFTSLLFIAASYIPYVDAHYTPPFFEVVGIVAVTLAGIYITFNTHQQQADRQPNYIGVVVALSVPIIINLILLAIVIGIFYGVVSVAINAEVITFIDSVMVILFQVLFFWRLNVHIKAINRHLTQEQ